MSKRNKIFCIIAVCLIELGIVLGVALGVISNNSNKDIESVSTNDEIDVSSIDEISTTAETVAELIETEPPKVEPPKAEILDDYVSVDDYTSVEPSITDSQLYLSDYERWVTECMVMGEAGGESYEGQVLVAQCIRNACEIEGLVPSEVRVSYQYQGWHNYPSESVKKAVSAVFDEGYTITNEPILYFYAYTWSTSNWHESQRFVISEGCHRFFARW